MTAHKHAAMIKAKADNMDLVVLRRHHKGDWVEVVDQGEIRIKQSGEYFLCLPDRKLECLHWLNDGDCEYAWAHNISEFDSFPKKKDDWNPSTVWLDDRYALRIKPRKEKRWIAYHKNGFMFNETGGNELDIKDRVKEHELSDYVSSDWQFIEIEVEV